MMQTADANHKVELFNRSRGRLFGIAYRMLGTGADAEDILQEAYLRWHKVRAEDVENSEAWLVTVVTRLSIDRLRKASSERETYIGPWLPEPMITTPSPQDDAELASSLSIAFLTMLERLSPTERAVFLLHDVFDCEYAEIARITDKTEAAVRQMAHRARERVRTDKRRFTSSRHSIVDWSNNSKLLRMPATRIRFSDCSRATLRLSATAEAKLPLQGRLCAVSQK